MATAFHRAREIGMFMKVPLLVATPGLQAAAMVARGARDFCQAIDTRAHSGRRRGRWRGEFSQSNDENVRFLFGGRASVVSGLRG